jgi:hypothetical protein
MLLCGIDPGKSGALFFMNSDGGGGRAVDMPLVQVKRNGKMATALDAHGIANLLAGCGHAFIELQ